MLMGFCVSRLLKNLGPNPSRDDKEYVKHPIPSP